MLTNINQQTLDLLDKIQQQSASPLQKAGISTGTGLVYYDLEAEAKLLYPVLTPLRNTIPRIGKRGPGQGTAAHWKIVTGINTTGVPAGVAEGKRGGAISLAEADKIATYKGLGLENSVAFEADYAAEGFDDVKALAVRVTMESLMIAEENMILHGNGTKALGVAPTPTVTGALTGGSLSTGNFFAYVVALGHAQYNTYAAVATGLVPSYTRTNADGTTDVINAGLSKISAQGSGSIGGSVVIGSLTLSCAAVPGAYGYAWFVGTTTGAANCALTAITASNSVVIQSLTGAGAQKADGTGGTNVAPMLNSSWTPSTDYSANSLAYDGLIRQAIDGNGYYQSLDGATLTSDSAGGIVEFDTVLKYLWDTYRISPSCIWVGGQQVKDITTKIINAHNAPVFRVNLSPTQAGQGNLIGSARIGSYLNKFALGGTVELPVKLHPNMPDGKVFFDQEVVPYPNANVAQARAIRTRKDYFQVEWPLVTRQYQYGVYCDEMLQCYVPFSMGLLDNIAAG